MRVFQNVEDLGDLKAALREAFEVKNNRFHVFFSLFSTIHNIFLFNLCIFHSLFLYFYGISFYQ